jgi:hypothetical protein
VVLRRGVGAPLGGLVIVIIVVIIIIVLGETGGKKIEGNITTFLIPRTALRGFFAILTTHRRFV